MAPPAAPAAVEGSGEGGGGAQRQQQEPGYRQTIAGIIRIAVFWYFASKLFSPRKPTPSDPAIQISNLFQKAEPLVLFSLYHLFFFPMCIYMYVCVLYTCVVWSGCCVSFVWSLLFFYLFALCLVGEKINWFFFFIYKFWIWDYLNSLKWFFNNIVIFFL